MERWTKRREPRAHDCPVERKAEWTAIVSALSRSASSKMMCGDFPPHSRVIRFRLLAAIRMISWAVVNSPVTVILLTFGCIARAAPTSSPLPVTTLTTPAGNPTSSINRASSSAVTDV